MRNSMTNGVVKAKMAMMEPYFYWSSGGKALKRFRRILDLFCAICQFRVMHKFQSRQTGSSLICLILLWYFTVSCLNQIRRSRMECATPRVQKKSPLDPLLSLTFRTPAVLHQSVIPLSLCLALQILDPCFRSIDFSLCKPPEYLPKISSLLLNWKMIVRDQFRRE